MKTLEEIKNEVAKDHRWDRYSQIEQAFRRGVISENSFNDFLTDVCKDYAQSVAGDLRERIVKGSMLTERNWVRNVEIKLP